MKEETYIEKEIELDKKIVKAEKKDCLFKKQNTLKEKLEKIEKEIAKS